MSTTNAGDHSPTTATEGPDPHKVFLVHGRNDEARQAMVTFLRSIGLQPVSWGQALNATTATKGPAPFIGDILQTGLDLSTAVVVLLTGDDYARIGRRFGKEKLTPQARPNVLFEAGMALGRFPNRTILVQLGSTRRFTDIAGRHYIEMDDTSQKQHELVNLLRSAGCAVHAEVDIDWSTTGSFVSVAIEPDGNRKAFEIPRRLLGTIILAALVLCGIWLSFLLRSSEIKVAGDIETTTPISLYIVGTPTFQYTFQKSSPLSIVLPLLPHVQYRAEYVADGMIVADKPIVPTEGKVANLGRFVNQLRPVTPIRPRIEVTDDQVAKFLQ